MRLMRSEGGASRRVHCVSRSWIYGERVRERERKRGEVENRNSHCMASTFPRIPPAQDTPDYPRMFLEAVTTICIQESQGG